MANNNGIFHPKDVSSLSDYLSFFRSQMYELLSGAISIRAVWRQKLNR